MTRPNAADPRTAQPAAEPAPSTAPTGAPTETPAGEPTRDPAGGFALVGRNRVGAGVRVLAGLALGSGLVASLGELGKNTSVSLG